MRLKNLKIYKKLNQIEFVVVIKEDEEKIKLTMNEAEAVCESKKNE